MTDDALREAAEGIAKRAIEVLDASDKWGPDPDDMEDLSHRVAERDCALRLLELLPKPDGQEIVTVDWFRSVGAEIKSDADGYTWCCLKTGTHTQEANDDGEFGPVVLEFGFREDGRNFDAVIGTYRIDRVPRVHGPDINIPKPVTRDRVRRLADALGLILTEQPA